MEIYLVGGAVRDELLGIPVKDRDWVVVGATPGEMLALGYKQVGADFPVFLHPKTREEYALARTERKQGHGYHGFTVYSAPDVTLEDDLERRDLTINAMAQAEDGTLVDPFGGRDDLEHRQLRHVSKAFSEDPLRILRAARFAARFHHLGFEVADETMALMRAMVADGEVQHLVPERVWQEFQRALHEVTPVTFFEVLKATGALGILIPELANNDAAFSNAMAALAATAEKGLATECRFAALLHPLLPSQVAERAAALKAPNDCRDLARLVVEAVPEARKRPLSAGRVYELFNHADAWRRPERFDLLLQTLTCLPEGLETEVSRTLERALEEARAVDARSLMAKGFKGKALGEAIGRERLRVIALALV
ncbi:multifunctional CCA tRNA nucleotidyl transferase/2'3'-cyclic phosphodiesterase/2'nucleotidase/phosphatase [Marinobacter bryozoorum]|uniref:multifunctional CCA tRNA nucleotidyl transferase/2'3'-cyclic phosphodiesterase/2'nucleotidase/phosphatase n=1 Tax=Marinobacter bryozoorum TaxID=256324 RepID=UPI002002C038|nr:multifunctional CCA tRNA nucleotidyl transferase/2'3'-cyclic phosphodiesterase/2'nucleotidase/phosphatase [Marinobacter bryozoorum]MCK7544265.1 multifunctional CCA tRNA nucleotidyl transferase/2'3'-cyclic phosphodiesterase/2'nucleotidase/phosphatase [Marinobacter bryozoorum]